MDLRIGIIGCGYKGSDHIARVAERTKGATLAGVCDLKQDLAEKYAKKYGAKVYKTGEELIEDPDIDAVMVVTFPDATHEQFVRKCIAVGKYCFCEKPMTPAEDTCMNIVKDEVNYGKRLVQVGFMRRYDNGYRALKEAMVNKTYGEPLAVHCTHRNEATPASGYGTKDVISNTAIHECDILHWLLDDTYDTVQAYMPKKQTKYTTFKHDPQFMTFNTKSGVHCDLEAFVNDHKTGYDINCEIVCEDGTIRLEPPTTYSVRANEAIRYHLPVNDAERFKQAFDSEIQDWVNAVKAKHLTGPSAWDGLMAVAATDALGRSRDNNGAVEKVTLPEKPDLYK
jgi:myo-inositol 2-dehydrogenase/D-chiro-inositol 1-dehydrogenase